MKVVVYVEGDSDKLGLQVLLAPLVQEKAQRGVGIDFFAATEGDRKNWLLTKAPVRAANILLNESDARVAIMPDLYPPDRVFPHSTAAELINGIQNRFRQVLERKRCIDERVLSRFRAFCFQYEFEVLVLAAEDALRAHLRAETFKRKWIHPPENQNHNEPPAQVLKQLFSLHGMGYNKKLTAALVLQASSYLALKDACPQSFGPFVEFLESL